MAQELHHLDGKVAIITGGGSGIGAASGQILAEAGAHVAFVDVNEPGVREAAARAGGNHLSLCQDVTSEAAWNAIVAATLERFGRIDILLNSAGITGARSIVETDLASLQRMWEINCVAAFLGIKAVTEPMKAVGGGSIINIASGYAAKATNNKFAYGTTKFAVRGLSRFAAHDLGPFGIRVNCILPGPIDTPMLRQSEYSRGAAPRGVAGPELLPLQRLGQPREIGLAVLYLASDLSSYVTGAELAVDGGALA